MKNLSKNIRSAEQERREKDVPTLDNLDRRKRPDRRLSGMDVSVVDVSETAYDNFIEQLIYKYK